jgi:hypothetical protein
LCPPPPCWRSVLFKQHFHVTNSERYLKLQHSNSRDVKNVGCMCIFQRTEFARKMTNCMVRPLSFAPPLIPHPCSWPLVASAHEQPLRPRSPSKRVFNYSTRICGVRSSARGCARVGGWAWWCPAKRVLTFELVRKQSSKTKSPGPRVEKRNTAAHREAHRAQCRTPPSRGSPDRLRSQRPRRCCAMFVRCLLAVVHYFSALHVCACMVVYARHALSAHAQDPCCGCWTWLLLTRTPSPRDHIVTEIGWSVPRSQVPIVRSPSPSTLPAALTLSVSALLACAAYACNAPCGPTASHTHPLAANPSPSGTRCTCCTCGQALRRRESCRSRSARCMRRARTQPLATLSIETSTSQGALHLHSTRTHPSLPQHAAGSSCGAMTTLHSHVVAITTTPLGRSCQRRC